eukprot:SAG22_NODE_165_length_16780_cov_57.761525_7_plen_197_part_00
MLGAGSLVVGPAAAPAAEDGDAGAMLTLDHWLQFETTAESNDANLITGLRSQIGSILQQSLQPGGSAALLGDAGAGAVIAAAIRLIESTDVVVVATDGAKPLPRGWAAEDDPASTTGRCVNCTPPPSGVMLLKAVITAFPSVSLPFLAVPLLSQPTGPSAARFLLETARTAVRQRNGSYGCKTERAPQERAPARTC